MTEAEDILQHLAQEGRRVSDLAVEDLLSSYEKIKKVKDGHNLAAATALAPAPSEHWDDEVVAIIVETRSHRNLPYVVGQAMTKGLRVQIYHGQQNETFLRSSSILPEIDAGRVYMTPLDTNKLSATLYNGLFLSQEFWRSMKGRQKIFVMQCDSCFCHASPYKLPQFLDYDYIGPAWRRRHSGGLISFGGIGGFTLRSWRKSVAALEQFDPKFWPAGEDRYFAFHIELLGGRVARPDESDRFCAQHGWSKGSFGAHKLNGLSVMELLRFLAYSPESWRILGRIEARRRG